MWIFQHIIHYDFKYAIVPNPHVKEQLCCLTYYGYDFCWSKPMLARYCDGPNYLSPILV
jgi:hypothetical protein